MSSIKKGSLVDCNTKLVNKETNSDVSFVFKNSNAKYFAHKLFLSNRSDVFKTMFYGNITKATTTSDSIEIEDIQPKIFLQILHFIYTDQIDLDDSNFAEIVYASEKYNIQFLQSICAKFLSERLNLDNVCSLFQQCFMYGNAAASEECLMFIDWTIVELIGLGKLDDLNEEALIMVIKRDSLLIEEFDLFNFVMKWSDANDVAAVSNAKKMKRNENPGERKGVSEWKERKKIFSVIRYPTMSLNEFAECYKLKNNLFNAVEIASIFEFCTTGNRNVRLSYSTTKRNYDPKFTDDINVVEFTKNINPTFGRSYYCGDKVEVIFTVNKPIELYKLHLISSTSAASGTISSGKKVLYTFLESIEQSPQITLLPNAKYVFYMSCSTNNNSTCSPPNQEYFNFPPFFQHVIKKIEFKPNQKNKRTNL